MKIPFPFLAGRKKRILLISLILLVIAIFVAGRTVYVSDLICSLIVPELEQMTGRKVSIGSAHINIFPLFVELDNFSLRTEDSKNIITIGKAKGYIGLFSLLNNELMVKRLSVKGLHANTDKTEIEHITKNIEKFLSVERKDALKVKIKSVLLADASARIAIDKTIYAAKLKSGEALLGAPPSYSLLLNDFALNIDDKPVADFSLATQFVAKGEQLTLKQFRITSEGSMLNLSGDVDTRKLSGVVRIDAEILPESAKRILKLKNSGEGKVHAQGSIASSGFRSVSDLSVDLKVSGRLYLETLMEILKVDEKLEGNVSVEGSIKGPLNDIKAEAKAVMVNGNLFNIAIDSVSCNIAYASRSMKFTNGKAFLYGGSADAEAMIALPVVNHFTLKVRARQANSKNLFALIGWDPGIALGKVDGELTSEGAVFSPRGNFSFRKEPGGRDIMERVDAIDGDFVMRDSVISFASLNLASRGSSVKGNGTVDIKRKALNLRANGATADIVDLSGPYFTALNGAGSFNAILRGSTDDPVLDIKFSSGEMQFHSGNLRLPDLMKAKTLGVSSITGDVSYKKNMLTVNSFIAQAPSTNIRIKGKINFEKAKHLFDIISPEYDLRIQFDKGSLTELASIMQGAPNMKGSFSSDFALTGFGQKCIAAGSVKANDIIADGIYTLDSLEAFLTFQSGEFNFRSLLMKKGSASAKASGMITFDKRYSVTAMVNNLDLFDVAPVAWREKMMDRNLRYLSLGDMVIKGSGRLSEPQLEMNGLIRYRDPKRPQASGAGKFSIAVKGKKVAASGNFMEGRIRLDGEAALDGQMPWRLNLGFDAARSDFLIAIFMKDVPEDLLVNLKGSVKAWGDKNNVNGIVALDKAHFYGYGYGFTNSQPINIKLQDKLLSVESFVLKNDLAELRIKGSAILGKQYNLAMDGASSLAPLRAAMKNADIVRGDASFALVLTGSWDEPKLRGNFDIVNGALGFKNLPHRMTALNARVKAEGDKIVIEEATGQLSGGTVQLKGAVYLDQLRLKRFYLESALNSIAVSVSKNFWMHFDGNLIYQGTPAEQAITGDLGISKARYTERIDWKSWLLQTRKKERPKMAVEGFENTRLNIKISGKDISIDNNVARVGIKADLLLKGRLEQPAMLGRIESTGGTVYFRNNEFKVVKGVIDFSKPDEIKPYFDMLAEARISNYMVRFALDGYIEQFNLTLSSTPALEENDILSLLAVGDVSKNLKGFQGGIGASEATSFLTGKLQDVVEDRLKTITGVDRIQIDPSVSKTTGTASPRVTISKRLLGDKFYATYSTAADVSEGQVIRLEYHVNNNTSLVGVRDEKGGLGTDIKFRFQFK